MSAGLVSITTECRCPWDTGSPALPAHVRHLADCIIGLLDKPVTLTGAELLDFGRG